MISAAQHFDRPVVELTGVSKKFTSMKGRRARTYTAVQDVNLSVRAGEFVSVIGPSGCGKSTILNMVAGLYQPSGGQVHVNGELLRDINRTAGYLFQHDALLPWKTVIDNTALGRVLAGAGKKVAREEARSWLKQVGLAGFEEYFPSQLSGGMRKRVAIAQNWLLNPDIMLMDEPFGALDAQTRQSMEDELLKLWQQDRKTVIFVTHDLDEAISLSDRIIVMGAGPGSRVVGDIEVDLPRPREIMEMRATPEFGNLHRRVWEMLRDEVRKTALRKDLTP